jgi:hypothetical protein
MQPIAVRRQRVSILCATSPGGKCPAPNESSAEPEIIRQSGRIDTEESALPEAIPRGCLTKPLDYSQVTGNPETILRTVLYGAPTVPHRGRC